MAAASPLKANRAKCVECSGGFQKAKRCSVNGCPLWSFRFARRPATVRRINPRLWDRAFVLLTGAVEERGPDVLDHPRQNLPGLLAGGVAAAVPAIRDTPPAVRFALRPRSADRVSRSLTRRGLGRALAAPDGSADSEAEKPTPEKKHALGGRFLRYERYD